MQADHNALAYIGLGSNLPSAAGSPAATLSAAIGALGACGRVVNSSSLYTTAPVGFADQPAFVNAVVALMTPLSPPALLSAMLAIEQQFGRDRRSGLRNGPRTLDLDLLLFGDAVLREPSLILPHPSLADRRFVLAPLAQVAPTLLHPVLRQTIVELLAALPDEGANSVDAVRCPLPGSPR